MMHLNVWASKLAEVLREFEDRAYQENIWQKGLGPEISSPDEAINTLYDDYDFAGFMCREEVKTDQELHETLLALDSLLSALPPEAETLAALDSPLWDKIRKVAGEARKELERMLHKRSIDTATD